MKHLLSLIAEKDVKDIQESIQFLNIKNKIYKYYF